MTLKRDNCKVLKQNCMGTSLHHNTVDILSYKSPTPPCCWLSTLYLRWPPDPALTGDSARNKNSRCKMVFDLQCVNCSSLVVKECKTAYFFSEKQNWWLLFRSARTSRTASVRPSTDSNENTNNTCLPTTAVQYYTIPYGTVRYCIVQYGTV